LRRKTTGAPAAPSVRRRAERGAGALGAAAARRPLLCGAPQRAPARTSSGSWPA